MVTEPIDFIAFWWKFIFVVCTDFITGAGYGWAVLGIILPASIIAAVICHYNKSGRRWRVAMKSFWKVARISLFGPGLWFCICLARAPYLMFHESEIKRITAEKKLEDLKKLRTSSMQKDIIFAINDIIIPNSNRPRIIEKSTSNRMWDNFILTLTNNTHKSITNYSITLQVYDCKMGYRDGTWERINISDKNVFSIKTQWDSMYQVSQINPGETVSFPYLSLACQGRQLPSEIKIVMSLKDTPLMTYGIDFEETSYDK